MPRPCLPAALTNTSSFHRDHTRRELFGVCSPAEQDEGSVYWARRSGAFRATLEHRLCSACIGKRPGVHRHHVQSQGHPACRGSSSHVRAGCVAVMKQLDTPLRLGLSGGPREERSAPTPTEAQLKSQYPGGATWKAVLWQEGDMEATDGDWLTRMRLGVFFARCGIVTQRL